MAEYCKPEELGIWGINPDATDDLSVAEKIKPAIEGASDVADSYLRARYVLPLLSWGNDLRRMVAIIAAYDLIVVRGYNPRGGVGEDQLRLRYEDALAWLKLVAQGTVSPEVTDSSPSATPGASSAGRSRIVSASQRGWSGSGDYPFQGD